MLRALPKNQLGANHWAFVTGPAVATLPEPAAAQERREACQRVLGALVQQLAARPSCWPLLERKLVMLEAADGSLPQEELLLVLRQAGLAAEQGDAEALAGGLPAGKPCRVDARALLRRLRERLGTV
jgi:hypothetical protein